MLGLENRKSPESLGYIKTQLMLEVVNYDIRNSFNLIFLYDENLGDDDWFAKLKKLACNMLTEDEYMTMYSVFEEYYFQRINVPCIEIKDTPLNSKVIFKKDSKEISSKGKIIATANKILKTDNDYGMGEWRICIYGGIAHGKVTYATSWQHLNEKSLEIANI